MIIAEIGNNHNGDMKLARWLIHSAKINGAEVAKFQVYDVDRLRDWVKTGWSERCDRGNRLDHGH